MYARAKYGGRFAFVAEAPVELIDVDAEMPVDAEAELLPAGPGSAPVDINGRFSNAADIVNPYPEASLPDV
jgi:hypothetical protein